MIERWIRKVKYFPEVRIETIIQNIPANSTVRVEEIRNIQGYIPDIKLALSGIQVSGNLMIFHGVIADDNYYDEFHSLGLQGINATDEQIYYEAEKNLVITARNVGTTPVSNYGLRYTWVIWNPDKIAPILNLQYPVYERFDIPMAVDARSVIERALKVVRKEVYTFVGDVPAATPITFINKYTRTPEELIVLEEFSSLQADVTVNIYREGEAEAGESFICSLLPTNLMPVKLWLPSKDEIKIDLYSTTGVSGFVAKAKIKTVKPVDKTVLEMIRV